MGAAIPSFIWGHQFLVFVIIMGDCNQKFTPTLLCCFYALLELFSYEQRGLLLGGRVAILLDHSTVTKDGRKSYVVIFKKLSYQTNNCQFLVSINAKTICSYFFVSSGLTYSVLAVSDDISCCWVWQWILDHTAASQLGRSWYWRLSQHPPHIHRQVASLFLGMHISLFQ